MNRLIGIGVLVVLVVLILFQGLYVLDESEQAIITQFGKPVRAVRGAGVHFKLPFLQQARYFDKRFLEWSGEANTQLPTKDKRFLYVDTYARWRIVDPLMFFKRVQNVRGAQSRLDDYIDGATRDAVASHDLIEIVRSTNRDPELDPSLVAEEQTAELATISIGRSRIQAEIRDRSRQRVEEAELGIEILDVRFMKINYNNEVRQKVYERMRAERKRIADRFRSEGEGEKARILGEKERRLKEIDSEAYRRAQEIQGRADAEATAIYADAYSRDPNFYEFLRTMELYPQTIDSNSMLILSTDGEFLRYLRDTR